MRLHNNSKYDIITTGLYLIFIFTLLSGSIHLISIRKRSDKKTNSLNSLFFRSYSNFKRNSQETVPTLHLSELCNNHSKPLIFLKTHKGPHQKGVCK